MQQAFFTRFSIDEADVVALENADWRIFFLFPYWNKLKGAFKGKGREGGGGGERGYIFSYILSKQFDVE